MTLSARTTKLAFKTNVEILVWMTVLVERVQNVSQRVTVQFVDVQLDGVVILLLNAINVGLLLLERNSSSFNLYCNTDIFYKI